MKNPWYGRIVNQARWITVEHLLRMVTTKLVIGLVDKISLLSTAQEYRNNMNKMGRDRWKRGGEATTEAEA